MHGHILTHERAHTQFMHEYTHAAVLTHTHSPIK